MDIVQYNNEVHGKHLVDLLILRGLPASMVLDIPSIGFVAKEDGKVIAMGFLRRIEGNCGMLDSYITDPHETSDYRDQALDLITAYLIETARSLEMDKLFEISAYDSIHTRAIKHGFSSIVETKTLILKL
jgi:hypothetical protein